MGRFLKDSGIDVGDNLLGPHLSNPYGHFEDIEILDFHKKILRREFNGEDQWVPELPCLTEEDRKVAMSLIEKRHKKGKPWGWKEPRTCLFLDFWTELIPEAKFLFLFRSPNTVLDSLSRRHNITPMNWRVHNKFINAWILYNRQILMFYNKYKERCILVAIEHSVENPDNFVQLLCNRLHYKFKEKDFVACYDASILRQGPVHNRWIAALSLHIKAWKLHRDLLRLSEI